MSSPNTSPLLSSLFSSHSLTSTMAPPKRAKKSLLEDPLSASSSSEDEEVEKEQKGSAVKKPKSDPKTLYSSDEEEEEEEDVSEESDSEPATPPKLKLIVSKPKKNALKPSSSTKSDDDEEEDVSEESDSEPATTPKLKPIASKLKKTVLKPSSSTKSDQKTPSDDDEEEESDSEPATTPKLKPIASKLKKTVLKPSSSTKSDPKTPSDDDEEEESDSEPETPPKLKPIASKPKMTVLKPSSSAKSDPKTHSSSDEEEEEEDDEPPLPKLKPIASKPKKTVSSVTPLKSSSKAKKRPFESEKDSKRRKKKKKQNVDDEGEEDEEESLMNNTPFQRIWSDEDEIVILKGMIESKKNGVDPLSDLKEFLESIKKSLQVKKVRQEQLKNKIKRLRKKFMNSSKRAKGDEDPVFSKPHELLSYKLMKKIWGGRNSVVVGSGKDDVDSVVVADGRRSSSRPRKSKNAAVSPVRFKMMTLSDDISLMELDGSNGYLHPCVQEWMFPRNDMNVVGGSFFKQGLDLVGDLKKKDFEQKWRSLTADELKVYLRRIQLVREQIIAILDVHKSSDASEHE